MALPCSIALSRWRPGANRKSSWRRFLSRFLLFAGIAGATLWAGLHRDQLDPAVLDAWLSRLGIWAPIAFVALYAAGTVAFVPSSLFVLTSGALFGVVWGAMLAVLGAMLGSSIAFLIARYIAGDWVARKTTGRLKKFIAGVEAEGWRFVVFVRLLPLLPFNLTNYALGLSHIRFPPYLFASLAGVAPGTFIYSWFGHAGRKALAGDVLPIGYGLLVFGLVNVAGIVCLPWIYSRMRRGAFAMSGSKNRDDR